MFIRVLDILHLQRGKGCHSKRFLKSWDWQHYHFHCLLPYSLEPDILQLFENEEPVFMAVVPSVLQMHLLLWLVFSTLMYLNMIKFQNREPLMPSPQFIKSYFSSFTDDIISQPMLKGEKSDEDKDKEGEALEVKEK